MVKKYLSAIFHEKSIYEISKPLHAQFKTYAKHQNMCNVKMPNMTKGVINQEVLLGILLKS